MAKDAGQAFGLGNGIATTNEEVIEKSVKLRQIHNRALELPVHISL